jgi:dTDP-4-amino-4,6-dideoxygalactose transaminase
VVSNATIGLELVIRALGLTGEVIVPSFTFVATAHALQWLGIRPVFCDIDPATHTLDPDRVEELIGPRTTGILGVHVWGRPCAPDRLAEIAERHGLELIFDAAHAFGCSFGATMIGNFGRAEVFSFHATKFVNSLEGGAIVTNDDKLAEKLRKMINFGFAGLDQVTCLGTNGKMNEFEAAMGLTSLDAMAGFVRRNRRNYAQYRTLLAELPGVTVLDYEPAHRTNFHYVVVEIDAARAGLGRDEIVSALWAENVLARRYFYPGCHRMEPYRTLEPDLAARLPQTVALCERVMLLPNGTAIGDADVAACCRLIGQIIEERDAVRRVLGQTLPGQGTEAPGTWSIVPPPPMDPAEIERVLARR